MNAFICHVPFHYYLFKSIYRHLNDSCFIIPPFSDKPMTAEYGRGMSAKGQHQYVLDFLTRKKVEVADYGQRSPRHLSKFLNQNAKNVIITQWFDGLYHLGDIRIIGLMYSLAGITGADRWVHRIEHNFFADTILTYGPDSAKRYKDQGLNAQAIGNPIFDDWFNNDVDQAQMESIKKRLDDNKPTILYLPTHGHFSSIDNYIDHIAALSNDYNIIVKLHHGTFIRETNRLCRLLYNNELIVLGDYFDPLPLYKLADIVLVDNSGAFFDALLLEKNIILLNVSYQDNRLHIFYDRDKSQSDENSIIFTSTNNPEELRDLVTNNIGQKVQIAFSLRYSLFFKADGNAGKRIAQIIMDSKGYPHIPVHKKYDRALNNVKDEKAREYILNIRNSYLRGSQGLAVSKVDRVKQILIRHLKWT